MRGGLLSRASSLVLVDYQARLLPAIEEGARVIERALLLAGVARALGVKVIGTEENPAGLGPNDARIRERCDATLAKMEFDATRAGLLEHLPHAQVVIAGCEAHVCLMQTALGLLAAGKQVYVVPEASGSRRAQDKVLAMQRLAGAGATLMPLESVAFEWVGTCEDPRFREVLGLVKAASVQG